MPEVLFLSTNLREFESAKGRQLYRYQELDLELNNKDNFPFRKYTFYLINIAF